MRPQQALAAFEVSLRLDEAILARFDASRAEPQLNEMMWLRTT
jgi:hypothetical protein